MSHVKPTAEELEANRLKALEDIEAIDKEEKKDPPVEDNPDKKEENTDVDDTDDEVIEDENTDTDKKSDLDKKEESTDDEKKSEKKEEQIDWKKRYADSTRQEQVSRLKEQKLSEAYDKADELPEPTDEELKLEFPDYDELSESSKKLAKKTLHNDRRLALISKARGEIKQIETWTKKVDEFISDPQTLIDNPELEGKVEAFKNFATKAKAMNRDLNDTVNAFLYLAGKAKTHNKGAMFETGTGGSNERRQPKSDKLTVEQGAALRTSNFRKWLAYVQAGKIATE